MNKNIIKFSIIFFGLLITIISFTYYKQSCNINGERLYLQGIELFNKQKYSDAYYNFNEIKTISKIYELALLKQFQCANNLNDKKTAHLKLKKLIKITKNEYIRPFALYNETLLSEELKKNNNSQLIKKYKYIQKKYPNSDFSIASSYKIALLDQKAPIEEIKNNYIKYLSYAPTGKYSLSSLSKIKDMNSLLTKEDCEIIANSYYENQKYEKALEYYKKANFAKQWYKIAKCYQMLKQVENEKTTILNGLMLKNNFVDEKNISYSIDRLATILKIDKKTFLQNLYIKSETLPIYPTVLYKLAESSNSTREIKLYENIVNNYPNSYWSSNSLWELFWYSYHEKHYKTCKKLAQKHIALYKNTQDSPRIAYWYGKTLLKLQKKSQAREIFYNVIEDYPLTYYAFLSARQLKMSKSKKMIIKKAILDYDKKNLNKYIFKDKLILQLANLNDWEAIDDLKINDNYINSWINHQKQNYPLAINNAKDELFNSETKEEKILFSNQLIKLIYPIYYNNEINKYSKIFKQSPYLLLSLIREESHFNKSAQSNANAIGLTQLLSSTADFIEKKNVSKQTLLIPDENIRIGTKYFTYLVDYFDKNEYLAILAYNAGPGKVKNWIKNKDMNAIDIDAFIEDIPYLETKNYIKKILSSYWIYINIYSNKNK